MKYRHKKTGTVLKLSSELHSPEWEAVPEKQPPAEPKPKKKVKPDDKLRRDQ